MFLGTTNSSDECHPAPSTNIMMWVLLLARLLTSSRKQFMTRVSRPSNISEHFSPFSGLTAPTKYALLNPFCRMTCGRSPWTVQILATMPFWPKRASSWNQMWILFPAWSVRSFVRNALAFFSTSPLPEDRSWDDEVGV